MSDPVFYPGSGSGFQVSMDPDPVFQIYLDPDRIPEPKKSAERALKVNYLKKTYKL